MRRLHLDTESLAVESFTPLDDPMASTLHDSPVTDRREDSCNPGESCIVICHEDTYTCYPESYFCD